MKDRTNYCHQRKHIPSEFIKTSQRISSTFKVVFMKQQMRKNCIYRSLAYWIIEKLSYNKHLLVESSYALYLFKCIQ